MLAILYVDQFFRKNNRVEYVTLRLIGIAAIILAVKLQEEHFLSVDQGVLECNGDFNNIMIQKTERMLLLVLDFKTCLPTPIEFTQFLLYLSAPTFDFKDLISECINFIYLSMLGKKFK